MSHGRPTSTNFADRALASAWSTTPGSGQGAGAPSTPTASNQTVPAASAPLVPPTRRTLAYPVPAGTPPGSATTTSPQAAGLETEQYTSRSPSGAPARS